MFRRSMGLLVLVLLTLLVFPFGSDNAQAQEGEYRTFRDKSGKYEIEARFVEFKDSKAVLQSKDGRTIRISMSALSTADRSFVRDRLAKKSEPAGENRESAAGDSTSDGKKQNWTDWRGVGRTGVVEASGLLDAWPSDGPQLLWRSKGLGKGYSSVAIKGDMLFTMGRTGDGDSELIAVHLPEGEVIWRTTVREGDEPPNCTPVIDEDRVYALGYTGNLICCDALSGKELWSKSFERDLGGRMMSKWGYSESPLIDGDRLICTPGASNAMLAALDKKTGRPIWTTSVPSGAGPAGKDGAGYSSPVISNGGGVKQYVQLVGRGLVGVDAKSGAVLWGYNRIANGTANVPTPLVFGDYVFGSTGYGDGGSALLKLERSGRGVRASEVYYLRGKETQNHHGGMVMIGDHIYMGHGHNNGFPLCIDWKTGQDAWRERRGPGKSSAAIIAADGHLYFRYQNGVMALIEATPAEYRLKGQFRLASVNGNSWPHPTIYGGRLYIRDQDELLCYDIKQ